jgi:hypothetical protein
MKTGCCRKIHIKAARALRESYVAAKPTQHAAKTP